MKLGAGYIPLESRYPLRGLNSSIPSTQVPSSFSPRLSNMLIREGVAYKRPGYYEFATTVTLVGDVLALMDFQKLDDTRILLALTSKRQYKYNDGTTAWVDITATGGQHAIKAVDTTNNWFKITDDHTALFLVDTEFVVTGSTGNDGTKKVTAVSFSGGQTQITIASVTNATVDGVITGVQYDITAVNAAANTITIDGDLTALFKTEDTFVVEGSTDIPDGTYTLFSNSTLSGGDTVLTTVEDVTGSTADGTVHRHIPLTTIEGDYIDWVVGTDNNTHRIYMTNGRDRPRFWDGVTGRFILWHPELVGFSTCRTLEVFFDFMILGNITLAGANVKLIQWSDIAEFETFGSGSGGALLIPGIEGQILRLEPLGDRLFIYSRDTIVAIVFIGGSIVFASEVILRDTRLVSAQAMVNIGPAHLFASQENVFFFDGTRSTRPVGDVIRELYKQDLDFEFGSRLFTFNDVARRMISIVIPTSSTTSVVYILDYNVFNLNDFKWTKLEYTDRPQSFGYFSRRTGPTWLDPPATTWEEEVGTWADESERKDFPVRVLGSGSKVHLIDETTSKDNGTAITASYETHDFVVPVADQSSFGRWAEIEVDLAGQSVDIHYSTDQGRIWTLVETKIIVGTFQQYNFPIDTTSRTLRVKLESKKFFSFRWIRVWVRPEGPR